MSYEHFPFLRSLRPILRPPTAEEWPLILDEEARTLADEKDFRFRTIRDGLTHAGFAPPEGLNLVSAKHSLRDRAVLDVFRRPDPKIFVADRGVAHYELWGFGPQTYWLHLLVRTAWKHGRSASEFESHVEFVEIRPTSLVGILALDAAPYAIHHTFQTAVWEWEKSLEDRLVRARRLNALMQTAEAILHATRDRS